jgi:hypothetical protein
MAKLTWALMLALAASLCAQDSKDAAATPRLDEIVRLLMARNQDRAEGLLRYQALRRYFAENQRLHLQAEMSVRENFDYPDTHRLETTSFTGSNLIRKHVFDKLLEAELDANRPENRQQIHITPETYRFQFAPTEPGHNESYVLVVEPIRKTKYVWRGRIWVDRSDNAIVKMEGTPAKNPSIWTRHVRFVRTYAKHGVFWLPSLQESESDLMFAGRSTLRIEYGPYQLEPGIKTLAKD